MNSSFTAIAPSDVDQVVLTLAACVRHVPVGRIAKMSASVTPDPGKANLGSG